jgi:hypothetical protein
MNIAALKRSPLIATGLIATTLLLAAGAAQTALAQSHEPERSRLMLVFAPDENSKQLQAQYEVNQRDTAEIDGEDVDVIYVVGDRPVKLPPPDAKTESAENLRKHYHVDANGFRVVLVGRDGWEKARWPEPTDPHIIVGRAADMPKPKSALDDQKH